MAETRYVDTMGHPTHDSFAAKTDRNFNRGGGYCFRCGFTWRRVSPHVTDYTEPSIDPPRVGQGCFSLCEGCWTVLQVPEARIEYYKMLVDHWESVGLQVSEDTKRDIMRAVANGR